MSVLATIPHPGMRSTQDGDIVFCGFVLSSVGDLSGALDLNKLNKALSRLEDVAFVNEQTQALRPPLRVVTDYTAAGSLSPST